MSADKSDQGVQGLGRTPAEVRAMLDAVTDYEIIQLDLRGNVMTWNRGAELITGYSAEEVIGQPVSVFYTEEDRRAGAVDEELRTASQSGRWEFEGWRVRKGGAKYWASVVLTPIRDEAGNLTGYVKVARDVSARRVADQVVKDFLDSAPDATLIVSRDGRIVVANRQVENLLGYSRDDLLGKEVETLVPPRFREHHPEYRDGFFFSPRVRAMGAGLDLWALHKDGSEVPVEISLSPIETDEGVLVSAAIRDVTERREQMQQLRRQRDEILELSTPVIQVWDKVLALPIIGTLDSNRAARLTESLLEGIGEQQAEVVILDISGVPTIDTLVAQHLLKTVQAATLMGAVSIMSGVRPETAQAMVHLGIDMGSLRSRRSLREALQLALQIVRDRSDVPVGAARDVGPNAER
jgi:rsbT co-antagonist protein RsbR